MLWWFTAPLSVQPNTKESNYSQIGSYTVNITDVQDTINNLDHRIYTPLTTNESHPLIIWGNGTGALPKDYEALLQHLASWGFIVVNPYSSENGDGQPLIETLQFIMSENENPNSFLFEQINLDQIGMAGHSQGSTGVINAHTNFELGNRIKTVVSISLPDLKWCDPEDVYDTSLIDVPFLILNGTADFIISPRASNEDALNKLSNNVTGVLALAQRAGHLQIQENGGKHRGMLTGWFMYQLQEDNNARTLFTQTSGEIFQNSGWTHAISNIKKEN